MLPIHLLYMLGLALLILSITLVVLLVVSICAALFLSYVADRYHAFLVSKKNKAKENEKKDRVIASHRPDEEQSYKKAKDKEQAVYRDVTNKATEVVNDYDKSSDELLKLNEIIYLGDKKQQPALSEEETRIVGVAEPVGRWTKFVMKQKMGYIVARQAYQNRNQGGFWVNLIKAQAASQGKETARGR